MCFAVEGQTFFLLSAKQADILRQESMYMKRARDNTRLESRKVVCSVPAISKMFCSTDTKTGSVLIGLIAWACY